LGEALTDDAKENPVKTLAGWTALLLAVCSVAGCGQGYDGVVNEGIKCWTEAAEVLATIHDEASAEQARPRLDGIVNRMAALEKRRSALPPMSREQLNEFQVKHHEAMATATDKLDQEMQRSLAVPGAGPVVYDFHRKMAQLQN
jgi:hypothetical protein